MAHILNNKDFISPRKSAWIIAIIKITVLNENITESKKLFPNKFVSKFLSNKIIQLNMLNIVI